MKWCRLWQAWWSDDCGHGGDDHGVQDHDFDDHGVNDHDVDEIYNDENDVNNYDHEDCDFWLLTPAV